MKNGIKAFAVMLVAAAIGFGAVHLIFQGGQKLAVRDTKIVLEVKVFDTKGRPLPNAEVSVHLPARKVLGRTDPKGMLRGRMSLPRGHRFTVEARGRNFKETRHFFAPKKATGHASVAFHLKKKIPERKLSSSPQKKSLQAKQGAHGGTSRPIRVDVFHGPGSDKNVLLQVANRLRKAASSLGEALAHRGVHALQLRHHWNEASYVEIVPVRKDGKAMGGYLLRSHKTDEAWLTFALKNMWASSFAFAPGHQIRTLTVTTSRPNEARAYLNGIPLPRKVTRAGAVFSLSHHPAARTNGAILTLTSDGGPLIRSAVSVALLRRNIQWTLPETALSKKETPSFSLKGQGAEPL